MIQPVDPQQEQLRAIKAVALTGCGLFAMSLPFIGLAAARGVVVGTAVAVFNLWAIARAVRAFLSDSASFSWGLFVVVKFSAVAFAIYAMFRAGLVQGLPLVLGLAALPIGVTLAQLAGPLATKEGNRARSQ